MVKIVRHAGRSLKVKLSRILNTFNNLQPLENDEDDISNNQNEAGICVQMIA